ncbi:hypothetical protein J7371_14930 [Xanthomonas phaseoli pv. dieffenbachiae]|uniref:hypothetical protein n=1 Tax=Xanthomonas phaseoli TaxID=1985254 RepID=UPI001ADAD3C6|nr:hypothetical protein [Xanthomonas phaseoli]MBO9777255.1 hypothetical protein [Xanthomonas phaseoli pv. dieffenbachiae]MBO9780497.1 hypothetical protein [Xanthomonas phaseoli pv. dieffenbachiae]MBO9796676.1 hypothetical protein [Xanthomonas phaseoli pv. dieffenbachiae]MBO9820708.1 hypothetical protein [Xanthomonas phaseoli pv. dieffenbachiae]MBO9830993.1 hypothetical protein [Xanthomonas phaseoli pv. dieffenbachiae]
MSTVVGVCITLGACSLVANVPELFRYDEPTDGAITRLRIVGDDGNTVIYPGTTCDQTNVPGFGRAARALVLGGQDLGMPRLSDTPKHPLELAVRAGQPMVVGFKAGAVTNPPCPKAPPGYRAICSPPPGHGPTCVSTRTFVPESGVDYEAHLDFGSGRCRLDVYALTKDARGAVERHAIDAPPPSCPSSKE